MARLRTIKPSFFANEDLAACKPAARLLFAGLWCLADRRGRLEDRPLRIRAEIFPYENLNADALLQQLAERGFIIRYEVDGQRLIQVVNFEKHQQPHYKEPESIYPAAEGHTDSEATAAWVPNEQRARIMARDGNKCVTCGTTEKLTIDHIHPRSRGGGTEDENLQVLCRSCNSSKNNRLAKVESSLTQASINKEGGLTPGLPSSVFRLPSLGSGLPSSGSGGADEPRHPPPRREPITDEFLDELVAEYAPLLGGEQRVRDTIAKALNHKASDKWKNKRQGLRDWLRRDADEWQERSGGRSGRSKPDPGGWGVAALAAATGEA